MKDHVFIVTKPLQLMVSLSIIKQLDVAIRSHIIIVDAFAGAKGVADRLLASKGIFFGLSVEFIHSIPRAYRILRQQPYSNIFIDADVGVRKGIDLFRIWIANSKVKINVYEEGVGTYRNDIYSGVRKKLVEMFGFSTYFGGFILTSNIYIYNIEKYKSSFSKSKTKAIKIRKNINSFINENYKEITDIFSYRPITSDGGDSCIIYLSNWKLDKKVIKKLSRITDRLYVKPHPHIVADFELSENNMIPAEFPAEIVIMDLIRLYKKVYVYHHGSSVKNYVKSSSVNYIEL